MGLTGIDNSRSTPNLDLRAAIRERIQSVREQLKENKQPATENQRRSVRRPFRFAQRIAAYRGQMPAPTKFYEVMCRDISTSGFSFQAQAAPGFTQLVVELGIPPAAIYVIARVARIQQEPDESFVIGCEFTGRACDES